MTNSVQSKKDDLFVCLLVCSFIEKNLQEAIPFVNILTASLVFNKNLIVDVDQHSCILYTANPRIQAKPKLVLWKKAAPAILEDWCKRNTCKGIPNWEIAYWRAESAWEWIQIDNFS